MARVKPKQKVIINPLEGDFDIITDNNFSYESVPETKRLEIPENMQMSVVEEFVVDGDLILEGTLVIEE
jgi:DNA helicase TIP49 (TBP-interacting protein)